MATPQVRFDGAARTASALARSPLLGAIPEADMKDLVRAGHLRAWHAGELIFQRGEPGDGIYGIVSGCVRIVLEGRDGNQVAVQELGPGDVFGELSALDGSSRSATAVAGTNVRALHVAPDRFHEWITAHPAVAVPMMAQLAHRLRTTNEQVAELSLLDVETRVARRLWRRFFDAAGREPHDGDRIAVRQTEVAAELGITRESVNKHVARLKAREVLAVDAGHMVLLDEAALRATARPD